MKDLTQKYTGTTASQYEAKRSRSSKWHLENEWFQECISKISIKTVLDAPVGTGRFLPLYQRMELDVTGLDVSADMLAIASQKGSAKLIHGDILNPPIADTFDLVVCVRFLNWLDLTQMQEAFSALSALSHKFMILSITTSNGESFTKENGAFIPSLPALFNIPDWALWHRVHQDSLPMTESTARMYLLNKVK